MASTLSDRREFYAAIIETALEGGIGYWAAALQYRWFDPELAGGTAEPGPEGTSNAYAVIVPADEEASFANWPQIEADADGDTIDKQPGAVVNVDTVRAAVGKIVRGNLGHHLRDDIVADIRNGYRQFDAGYLDATAADVIVQIAVFGEVVFS